MPRASTQDVVLPPILEDDPPDELPTARSFSVERRRIRVLSTLAGFAAGATLAASGIVLWGWVFDVQALKSFGSARVSINPDTAVAFLLAAVSLLLLQSRRSGTTNVLAQRASAAGVVAVGLSTLFGVVIGENLAEALGAPNRMGPITALALVLIGVALLLRATTLKPRLIRVSEGLVVGAAVIGFLAILGNACGARQFSGDGHQRVMSLTTAIGLMLLSTGVFCSPPHGNLLAILAGEGLGGRLARRLLPVAVIIPTLLGMIRLAGEEAGLYDTRFGTASLIAAIVLVFAGVTWWSAAMLGRVDGERLAAMRKLTAESSARDLERRRLQAVLDALPVGVFLTDAAGRILEVNAAAKTIWADGPLAQTIAEYDAYKAWWSDSGEPLNPRDWGIAQVLEQGETRVAQEIDIETFDGRQKSILAYAVPIRGEQNEIAGAVAVNVDITEHKDTERELRDARWFLEQAQTVAHVGSWVSGLDEQDVIEWSAESYRIFGVDEGEPITVERFFTLVHPEDVAGVRAASQAAIVDDAPYDIEHRIVRPDGEIRTVHERAIIVSGPHSTPRLMVGTVQDVTDRVRIEEGDRFLSEASGSLAEVLEFPEILNAIARAAVPRFADACLVELLGKNEQHFAVSHVQRERESAIADAFERFVPRLQRLAADEVERHPRSPPHGDVASWELARALGAASIIRVPLHIHRHVFGTVVFVREPGRAAFDDFDARTATTFTRRAAFAVENARLFRAAQDSLRVRDEFIAIAAHELRTPLTPLQMQAQALAARVADGRPGELSPERLARPVHQILRSSGRLITLVETLLDVLEMTVGAAQLELAPRNLTELAADVVRDLEDELERAGCTVVWKTPATPMIGTWDGRWLELAIRNLVSNAMKFAPGKPIEISIEGDETHARLAVQDQGPGLNRQEQAQLFERYRRPASIRHYGGFGLGLWVVRRVAEDHGGWVELSSEPGAGARFVLVLPRQRATSTERVDTQQRLNA